MTHAHAIAPSGLSTGDTIDDEILAAMTALHHVARLWSRDTDAAGDLIQDTLERALRTKHRYRPGTNAVAWVRAIMYHLAIDESRRQTRELRLQKSYGETRSDQQDSLPPAITGDEGAPKITADLETVKRAALSLREPLRRTFIIWLNERPSYKALAARLGIPANTVATRLLRARAQLRVLLKDADATAMARPRQASRPARLDQPARFKSCLETRIVPPPAPPVLQAAPLR